MTTGLNHLTLAVRDLERATTFYRDILGFALRAHWPEGAYLEAGSLWLCLSLETAALQMSDSDYSHIALNVEEDDFASMNLRIRAAAPIWRQNTSEGASVYFLDPDGHKLELHVGSMASRLAHYRANPTSGVLIADLKAASGEEADECNQLQG